MLRKLYEGGTLKLLAARRILDKGASNVAAPLTKSFLQKARNQLS